MDSSPNHVEVQEYEIDKNAAKTKIKYSCFANAEAAAIARGDIDIGRKDTKRETDNISQ